MRALDQRLKRLESRVNPTESRPRLRVGHERDETGRVARMWVEHFYNVEIPGPVGRSLSNVLERFGARELQQ